MLPDYVDSNCDIISSTYEYLDELTDEDKHRVVSELGVIPEVLTSDDFELIFESGYIIVPEDKTDKVKIVQEKFIDGDTTIEAVIFYSKGHYEVSLYDTGKKSYIVSIDEDKLIPTVLKSIVLLDLGGRLIIVCDRS